MRRFLLCLLVMPSEAFATCATPPGEAGHVIFNTTTKTMQYCNGTQWVNTGPSEPAATQTGCVSPTGVAGQIIYAAPLGVVQFCNGQSWIDTACAAKRKPNGSGCGGQAAGTLRYESTHNELQFCDSTDWVAMGWGCSPDQTAPVWHSPSVLSYTAMQGQPFSLIPSVTDDKPGLVYSLQGTIPTGMSFTPSTGALSGTPSALGSYTFTLRATDTSANSVERTFTVDVIPAEVVVHIAADATNVNLQSLFNGTDWADTAKTKRVIVDAGVMVGSTSAGTAAMLTGTGRGKDLMIENRGTIAGAGGAANGGAGGPAIHAQQTGVTITNTGNIYGGGGGGGQGGKGGGGSYATNTRQPSSGDNYSRSGTMYYYQHKGTNSEGPASTIVMWAGSILHGESSNTPGPLSIGSATYYAGTARGDTRQGYFGIYRIVHGTTNTNGGAGGNGGRGQGSDGAATAGLTGAAGGTNAGAGGTGGAGGAYGSAGAAGATGTAGNSGAGLAGSAGGAAGAAVTGSGYTVTNTGSILGSY